VRVKVTDTCNLCSSIALIILIVVVKVIILICWLCGRNKRQGYVRLWSPEGICEMNDAYNIQASLPGAFAIGDDEGGTALLLGQKAPHLGLYLMPFSCLEWGDGVFLAPTLEAFLSSGEGADWVFG